jgi:hypothetical protein
MELVVIIQSAVMAVGESNENSTKKLQSALNKIAIWTKKWRTKLNESKSVHIDFTNKRITQRPIYINGTQISYLPIQQNISVPLSTLNCGGRSILKRNVTSSI